MGGLGSRIRKIRMARSWSQSELAKIANVKQATVSRWENCKSTPEEKHLTILARLGNLPEAELKYGNVERIGLKRVPVVGYVGAGEAVFIMGDQTPNAALEYVPAPPNKENQELVAVRIRGDSMRPLRHGWLVYYGRNRDGVPDECLSQLCVVQLADGNLLVKELRRGHIPGHFTLHSWSAGTDPIEDAAVVWVSPVQAIIPS